MLRRRHSQFDSTPATPEQLAPMFERPPELLEYDDLLAVAQGECDGHFWTDGNGNVLLEAVVDPGDQATVTKFTRQFMADQRNYNCAYGGPITPQEAASRLGQQQDRRINFQSGM